MFTATKKQQHYLKQLAALQFPCSIDNLSTRLPIYALEQQLPKDDTVKLDDAVIEGQDIEYSKFYDEDGCSYSSVSELYLSNKRHYVLVKKGDDSYEVPYPFDCDKTVEALNRKNSEEEALTAAQRLFFWTEYKEHSNDI